VPYLVGILDVAAEVFVIESMASFVFDLAENPRVGGSIPPLATIGKPERQATRLVFLVVGFVAAAWACLVPFAKANAQLDEGTLGLVLLCLGAGSILSMPTAGALSTRYGCRVVLTTSSLVACAALPLLATVSSAPFLAVVLFVFGAALGSADCVMNVQAVIVERAGTKPRMSGFHAFYSLGGIVGAASISILLMLGATPLQSALAALAVMVLAVLIANPGLLSYGNPTEGPAFAIPHGVVLFLGVLCFIVFLVEGSMMDWSAVLTTEQRGTGPAQAGFAFASFSMAMTLGRLIGDRVVARMGRRSVVTIGALLAAAGIALATSVSIRAVALLGYALVGLGCSNIVPVLFSAVGRQKTMPQAVAVPAITTLGYAGILTGPAGIGFIAQHSSLTVAFLFVATLMVAVAASSGFLRTLDS
jgi:predicted MFS family arabinose efflux permease